MPPAGTYSEVTPFRGEREDGLATLAWLKRQNWCDGQLLMAGARYLGFTQWAIARDAGPMLKAFSTHVTSAEFRSAMYPGECFQLEIFLQWVQITHAGPRSPLQYLWALVTAKRCLSAATWRVPLSEADEVAVGEPVKCWREWLHHSESGDGWWAVEDYSHHVQDVTAPNYLASGWHDFLPLQFLRDYAGLQQAGRRPSLTIGPWAHSSLALQWAALRESLLWLRAHVQGETADLRTSPVRIYVMGADEWRDLQTWPPNKHDTSSALVSAAGGGTGHGASSRFRSQPVPLSSRCPLPQCARRRQYHARQGDRPTGASSTRGTPRCAGLYQPAACARDRGHWSGLG